MLMGWSFSFFRSCLPPRPTFTMSAVAPSKPCHSRCTACSKVCRSCVGRAIGTLVGPGTFCMFWVFFSCLVSSIERAMGLSLACQPEFLPQLALQKLLKTCLIYIFLSVFLLPPKKNFYVQLISRGCSPSSISG